MPEREVRGQSDATEGPWYRDGLAFQCTGCGDCCTGTGYVWVDDEEIESLAAYQSRSVGEVRLLDTRPVQGKVTLREHSNGDCIYLDGRSRRCSVYEARPRQCKSWPFWRTNLTDKTAWEETGRACPGVNRGALVQLEVIEQAAEVSGL